MVDLVTSHFNAILQSYLIICNEICWKSSWNCKNLPYIWLFSYIIFQEKWKKKVIVAARARSDMDCSSMTQQTDMNWWSFDLIFQRNSRWWRDKIIDLMKKNWKYLLKNRNNTLSICYHLNLTHKLISYKEQIYQTVKLLACFKAALQNTWCKGNITYLNIKILQCIWKV